MLSDAAIDVITSNILGFKRKFGWISWDVLSEYFSNLE
jgi:hypothetical protein